MGGILHVTDRGRQPHVALETKPIYQVWIVRGHSSEIERGRSSVHHAPTSALRAEALAHMPSRIIVDTQQSSSLDLRQRTVPGLRYEATTAD
jgi:hypothetical protein